MFVVPNESKQYKKKNWQTYVCPQCSTTVHVRRAVCACGCAFHVNVNDSLTVSYKCCGNIGKSQRQIIMQASKTLEQTQPRQEQDKCAEGSAL